MAVRGNSEFAKNREDYLSVFRRDKGQEALVIYMKRLSANLAMAAPEELMKNWMAFGGQASEQFLKLMSAAAGGSKTRG